MTQEKKTHPSEESLIAYSIDSVDQNIALHAKSCPECSDNILQMKKVFRTLKEIPDEDVPERLHQKILNVIKKEKRSHTISFNSLNLIEWYKNPVIIALVIILMGIFVFLFIFLLL